MLGVAFNHSISDDDDNKVDIKAGDLNKIIYSNEGLYCGGADGCLRFLDWTQYESEKSKISEDKRNDIIRFLNQIIQSKVIILNEEILSSIKPNFKGVISMSASPGYDKIAVLRECGLVQILQRQDAKFKLSGIIRSNFASLTGICSIDIGQIPYFVVSQSKLINIICPRLVTPVACWPYGMQFQETIFSRLNAVAL